jgi:type IV pilus assembly protein PilA
MSPKKSRQQQGFSLIELLIVVAIILIIVSMAIPGFRQNKMSVNEASAVASLKAIQQAQISYQLNYPTKGYAENLASLGSGNLNGAACTPAPVNACILDSNLSSGSKNGYKFQVQGGNPINGANTTYGAGAAPERYNSSGVRLFCTTEDNLIRFDANLGGTTTPPNPTMCAGGGFATL